LVPDRRRLDNESDAESAITYSYMSVAMSVLKEDQRYLTLP